jgi:predicted alpha/beta-fold hydrolase
MKKEKTDKGSQIDGRFQAFEPGFRLVPKCIRGDLQSLWVQVRYLFDPTRWKIDSGKPKTFDMPDGDKLIGTYHVPDEYKDKPLVLVVHGLPAGQDSGLVMYSTRFFLGHEYPVLRINLRGADKQMGQTRKLYHAGRSEDLAEVIRQIAAKKIFEGRILVFGMSYGGNTTLKLMAEKDLPDSVMGAVVVSGSIDLATTNSFMKTLRMPRKLVYGGGMLSLTRGQFKKILVKNQRGEMRIGLSKDDWFRIARAKTLFQFDRDFFARFSGFDDVEHYYSDASAASYARNVKRPTLVIHSQDDPFVPADPCELLPAAWVCKLLPGKQFEIVIDNAGTNPRLSVMLTPEGGHVGFWPKRKWFRRNDAWHDVCAGSFFHKVQRDEAAPLRDKKVVGAMGLNPRESGQAAARGAVAH